MRIIIILHCPWSYWQKRIALCLPQEQQRYGDEDENDDDDKDETEILSLKMRNTTKLITEEYKIGFVQKLEV